MNPQTRRRRILLALPAVAFASLILILSTRPGTDLPSTGILHGDKVLHLTEYFVLGLLLLLPVGGLPRWNRLLAPGSGIALAAIDEFIQTLVPGRSGDVLDFAVDVVGLVIALGIAVALRLVRPRKDSLS